MLHKYSKCRGNLAETYVTKVGWVIAITFILQFLLLGLYGNLALGEKTFPRTGGYSLVIKVTWVVLGIALGCVHAQLLTCV